MADVVRVRAATNNEVAFISWDVDEMIPGCLGFEITRIYPDTGDERCLASWVPFTGQRNPNWEPQDTGVWPVQKTSWRDLTVRRRRDEVSLRPLGQRIRYRVRPVGLLSQDLEAVPVRPLATYSGAAVPLGYLGKGAVSGDVFLTSRRGPSTVAFTNGVLSTQWMARALEKEGIAVGQTEKIRNLLETPGGKIRNYLMGEVGAVLKSLLERAVDERGRVRLALYELGDKELADAIVEAKDHVEVILANSGKDKSSKKWDYHNAAYRTRLHAEGVVVHDRIFNNNHIGHNKFAVYLDRDEVPRAVLTGSTNWTSTGICGQSNNVFVRDDDEMASVFNSCWELLRDDQLPPLANPWSNGTVEQVQGHGLRLANHQPKKRRNWTVWLSPNDPKRTKKDVNVTPVDLADVFSRIDAAKEGVFFLAFNPSPKGENSVVQRAVQAGRANRNLVVMGAISEASAMPNFRAPTKDPVTGKSLGDGHSPFVFPERVLDEPNISIVRAAQLTGASVARDFQAEVLKAGHAVVHDKVVIIDPTSSNATVITGSHNLGFKASYENDENMVVIEGDRDFASAYMVHFLDIYDHYKFRAWRRTIKKKSDLGLEKNDQWLRDYVSGRKGALARYFP